MNGAPAAASPPSYSEFPNNWWLDLPRSERQAVIYDYYTNAGQLLPYPITAAQALHLVESGDVWPTSGEHDWWNFVAELKQRAEADDRAAQELQDGIIASHPPFARQEHLKPPTVPLRADRRYSGYTGSSEGERR